MRLGLLLFLLATTSFAAEHYSFMCRIYDQKGHPLRSFQGMLCHFFSNGDLLLFRSDRAFYFDHEMKVKWERPGEFHHFMTVSRDERFAYVLGSSVHSLKLKAPYDPLRFDTVVKIDIGTGKVVRTWDSFNDLVRVSSLMGRALPVSSEDLDGLPPSYNGAPPVPKYEFAHFNSVREVPPNAKGFFKPGQLIVNANNSGAVLIFDTDLRLLDGVRVTEPRTVTHTAIVNEAGNLLLFINGVQRRDVKPTSSAIEFDPVTKKVVWTFPGVEGLGPYWGDHEGYFEQIGEDRYLFSTEKDAWEVDRGGKTYWHKHASEDLMTMPLFKQDLTAFLRANQG